jgi:CRP-like cAMP-binding protein
MDSREKWREASRERVKAAESRLQHLRDVIERRARAGFDTSEGWRLFRLTASSLANIRQTEALLAALSRTGESGERPLLHTTLTVNGGDGDRAAFNPGTAIQTAAREIEDCHLIESGLVSLCFGDADGVEVAMLGPGGIVNMSALLGTDPMPITAVATTRCRTFPVPLAELASRIGSDVKGLRFLHGSVARQWAETMIIARCNAEHSVRERVSRWILTGARHLRGPIGPISHDRIASLLGVRRASITVALHEIEGQGAITSRRNVIEIKDEQALELASCDCQAFLFGERQPAIASLAHPTTH